MNRPPERPPSDRHETVERREIIETREVPERTERVDVVDRRGAPAFLFLIPLVLVVLVLVWFIFARGERRSPADLEVTVPEVELPVQEERRIEIAPAPPAESPPAQQPGQP